jgi:hypothetical protein
MEIIVVAIMRISYGKLLLYIKSRKINSIHNIIVQILRTYIIRPRDISAVRTRTSHYYINVILHDIRDNDIAPSNVVHPVVVSQLL